MIRKVALAGKGYVGGKIYDVLVNSGFKVTVLSRTHRDHHTRAIDCSSIENLTELLAGQDAVVSALPPEAWESQLKLFDAAINARVKHFIPSDYTSLSTVPEVAHLPYWEDLARVQQHLREKAGSTGIKWSILATGPLLECVLNGPYMYNFEEHKALVTGDGDFKVSMTTGPALGNAIAKVLSKSDQLESGFISVHEVVTSQNELLKSAERLFRKQWMVQHVEAEDTLHQGLGMIKASQGGELNRFGLFLVIQGTNFSGKYKAVWDGSGNKLLDLPLMSNAELGGLIATRVKGDVLFGGLPWKS